MKYPRWFIRYLQSWGNFCSDKHKKKVILRVEIDDILRDRMLGMSKEELIEFRNFLIEFGEEGISLAEFNKFRTQPKAEKHKFMVENNVR